MGFSIWSPLRLRHNDHLPMIPNSGVPWDPSHIGMTPLVRAYELMGKGS